MDPKSIQAFPSIKESKFYPTHEGMTLRDYFAGQAIIGLMAMIAAGKHDLSLMDGSTNEERLAVAGYRVADAMIETR